jgi:hypothetical protein
MFWLKFFKKGYKLTMPKKTTTAPSTADATTTESTITVARVEDIVDRNLRKSFQEQARELELHLKDIDKRLKALERK